MAPARNAFRRQDDGFPHASAGDLPHFTFHIKKRDPRNSRGVPRRRPPYRIKILIQAECRLVGLVLVDAGPARRALRLLVLLGAHVLLEDGLGLVDLELGLEVVEVARQAAAVGAAARVGEVEVPVDCLIAGVAPGGKSDICGRGGQNQKSGVIWERSPCKHTSWRGRRRSSWSSWGQRRRSRSWQSTWASGPAGGQCLPPGRRGPCR